MKPLSNYPPGAEHDPRAPWNQKDFEGPWTYTIEMTVYVKSLSEDDPQETINTLSEAIKSTLGDDYEVDIDSDYTDPEPSDSDDD